MVEISFDGGKEWSELVVNMRTVRLMQEHVPEVKTWDEFTARFVRMGDLEPVEMIRTLHVLCMQAKPGITEDEMLDALDDANVSPVDVAAAIASAFVASSFVHGNQSDSKKKVLRITGKAGETMADAQRLLQSTSKGS